MEFLENVFGDASLYSMFIFLIGRMFTIKFDKKGGVFYRVYLQQVYLGHSVRSPGLWASWLK